MAETKKKRKNIGAWVIMGLLFFGLIGFSTGSFGGGGQVIGTVGQKQITAQSYFTALQGTIRNFQAQTGQTVSFPEAQEIGLQQQALAQLVNQRALDNEAAELGLSVGDTQVSEEVQRSGAFVGLNGRFDRALYSESLRRNGMTEASYENQVREDLSRQLLQISVATGIETPPTFINTVLEFLAEERSFTWALLDETLLDTPLPTPTEAELQAEYEANPDAYTLPEIKVITYAWLTPDMILDTVEVDEQALRDLYASRLSEYDRPERRLVERLVFGSQDQAQAARARIDGGATFEEEVEARGLALSDIDLGDVVPADLGSAAEAVFGTEGLDIVGPVNTSLGPALFRVNAILPEQTVPFEVARDELQDELALDRAARVIADQIEFMENELAGGATIEDLVATTDMELGTIDWFPGESDGAGAYAAFQEAAATVTLSDFPEIAELDDGGIFALRLDTQRPPELQPLADVRDEVIAAWEASATVAALQDTADALVDELTAGMGFDELTLANSIETGVTRGSFILGTPPEFLDTVFAMSEGETRSVPGIPQSGTLIIVRLDEVTPADPEDPAVAQILAALQGQIAQSYAQDLYATYSNAIVASTPIRLDQGQINGIHAQMQ
ncbi:MAG: SurA N-terminal domain-containing protein [Pseudomonadota bacterium]